MVKQRLVKKSSCRAASWDHMPDGSFTVEASFVVPLILFAVMALTAMGMNCAKTLSVQIRAQEREWEQRIEDQICPSTVLRIGSEALNILDLIGSGRDFDLGDIVSGALPNEEGSDS